jgi:hypothetical protein
MNFLGSMKNLFKSEKLIGWSLGLLPIFYLLIAYISFSREDIFLNHLEKFSYDEVYIVLIIFIFIFIAYSLLFINREFLEVGKKYYYYILTGIIILCFVIPPFMSRDLAGYLLGADIFWRNLGDLYSVNVSISSWAHYLGGLWWLNLPSPYGPFFIIGIFPAWLAALKSFILGIYVLKIISLTLFIFSAWLLKRMTNEKIFWLYVFNPAILINFVLEGHNDIWIAVLLLIFIYKKKKILSKHLFLVAAIFVKYTAIILWPLTWFRDSKFNFKSFLLFNSLISVLLILFFLIFSINPLEFWSNLSFLDANCFYRCSPLVFLLPNNLIRLILFALAYGLVFWFFLYKKHSPVKFIFWSLLALFMIKITWLTPWYMLILVPISLLVKDRIYHYIGLGITFYGLFHYLFI